MNRRHLLKLAASTPLALLAPNFPAVASTAQPWRQRRTLATGLSSPVGVAIETNGSVVIANWSAGTIVRIDRGGNTTTLTSGLSGPAGLAISSSGDIFIASYSQDLVWRMSPNGGKPKIFVTGLATPAGISFDNHGNLLIANRRTNQVLAATPDGKMSVAVQGELQTPVGAVQMPDGSYFVANISGGISYAGNDGAARTVSRAFASPGAGIAIADTQSVYVVDYGGTEVKRVDKNGTTHVVADGFRSPVGLAVSREQNRAIVVDWGTNSAYEMEMPI